MNNSLCGVFIFWVSNQKSNLDVRQKPIEFLCFSPLWVINTEKVSLLLMCYVKKCSWKWLSVKLPSANWCNCIQYGLMCITWKYNAMNESQMWLQNWLRQTWNVSVFTFIKHLFKFYLFWNGISLRTTWLSLALYLKLPLLNSLHKMFITGF